MLTDLPRGLTPIEWRILLVLWDLGSVNPAGVAAHLKSASGIEMTAKAVRIVLLSLKELGLVRAGAGPRFGRGRPMVVYGPVIERVEAEWWLVRRFLHDTLSRPEDLLRVLSLPLPRRPS
jgi:predicted transcriptional regulator